MCILTMKTVTQAMKACALLRTRDISCETVSLDPSLSSRGCAYGIGFPDSKKEEVLRLLASRNIPWGEQIGGKV